MFWRNGFRNNRSAYHNGGMPASAPAWSTSSSGQPVQRLQNMLQRAQQAHANQAQQVNQQKPQLVQQQPKIQPQAPHHNPIPSQSQPQQNQQYYDPSVSFEPLSEDMLKLMGQQKETAKTTIPIPQAETYAPVGAPIVHQQTSENLPEKSVPQEIPQSLFTNPYLPKSLTSTVLSDLMQDEQNGAIFYRYLSKRLNNGATKDSLLRIAIENEKRITILNEMHKDVAGKGFEPQQNTIEFNDSLHTCLRAAATEENNIIEKIIALLEYEKNNKLEIMLFRKLNTVNLLLSL